VSDVPWLVFEKDPWPDDETVVWMREMGQLMFSKRRKVMLALEPVIDAKLSFGARVSRSDYPLLITADAIKEAWAMTDVPMPEGQS
jgi:uncharacterized SAM-binding protein YcdF (DUF218 family)